MALLGADADADGEPLFVVVRPGRSADKCAGARQCTVGLPLTKISRKNKNTIHFWYSTYGTYRMYRSIGLL